MQRHSPARVRQTDAVELSRDDYFDLVRTQIYHEDDLINQRLTWLVTGETFLYGFHGISAINVPGPHPLAALGIAMGIVVYVSILAAIINLSMLRRRLDGFVRFGSGKGWPVPNVTASHWPIRYAGLVAPIVLPLVFITGWILILMIKPATH